MQANQQPSPPASPSPFQSTPSTSSPQPTISALAAHLDALLASYLTLLDTYTTLRSQLSSNLSSGFLSLAAANRNAATILGPGRRFGDEGFDGRMRASRRVTIERRAAAQEVEQDLKQSASEQKIPPAREPRPGPRDEANIPSSLKYTYTITTTPPTPTPTTTTTTTTSAPTETDTKSSSPPSASPSTPSPPPAPPPPRDPLTWYTALPPPALRQTQAEFIAALSPITALLNVSAEMTELGERIRRARGELAALTDVQAAEDAALVNARHGHGQIGRGEGEGGAVEDEGKGEAGGRDGDGDGDDEADEKEREQGKTRSSEEQEEGESSSRTSAASPLKGQLASRSRGTEPRSRVLKMQ